MIVGWCCTMRLDSLYRVVSAMRYTRTEFSMLTSNRRALLVVLADVVDRVSSEVTKVDVHLAAVRLLLVGSDGKNVEGVHCECDELECGGWRRKID